ncbi:MAG: hypothetical protein JST92_12495, partial [Deltaproteobacteria bacterium]|nr:hypothetical protein [Deltaproteobacteria bacterium]
FVMRGGGLFIALGDNVDPDAYNDSLKGLLPRPLHLLKTALDPDQPDVPQGAPDRAARFGLIDWTHPLFRVFGPQEREAVESVRTFRYALLKPEGTGRALVSFDDGAPALVEANVGAGRVLLLTTSASATWTDWPIRPSFLPVMQQATSLLAGALDEKPSGNAEVGELRALQTPEGQKLERVLGPDGKDVPLVRDEATPGELKVPVSRPGVHHVMLSSAGQPPHEDPALSFVARLDPKEADLTRVDEREVKAWLGGGQTAQVASSSREAQGNHGTPLWGFLFVLAALAVLGEGALTRK